MIYIYVIILHSHMLRYKLFMHICFVGLLFNVKMELFLWSSDDGYAENENKK